MVIDDDAINERMARKQAIRWTIGHPCDVRVRIASTYRGKQCRRSHDSSQCPQVNKQHASRHRLFFFASSRALFASPTRFVTIKISAIDLGNRASIRHEFIIGCFIVSSESDLDPVPLLETAERPDNRAELNLGLHSHHELAIVVREPEEVIADILLLTVLLS